MLACCYYKNADLTGKIVCVWRKYCPQSSDRFAWGIWALKGRFCSNVVWFKRKSDSTAFKICRSKLFHPSVTFWGSWKGRKKSVWRPFLWRQGTERLKMISSWAQVKAEQMHMIKAALTWTWCLKLRYPSIPSHRRYALSIHLSFRSRKTGKICYKALRAWFWPYCDRKSYGNLLIQLLDYNPHD